MMHEDFFGGDLSTGTVAVLDVCRSDAPDFSILLHGGSNTTCCILPPEYGSMNTKKEVYEVELKIKEQIENKANECREAGRLAEEKELIQLRNILMNALDTVVAFSGDMR